MDMYLLVLSHKVKRYLEGLLVLCLGRWKRKVIHGMFKWLGGNYEGFDSTREGATLGGGWTTRRRRESRRGVRVKSIKLEIYLIALRYTLPRLQADSCW